jgi:integrase
VETIDIVDLNRETVCKHKLHSVFLNTKSGQPYVSKFVVGDRLFKAHLKANGVRE